MGIVTTTSPTLTPIIIPDAKLAVLGAGGSVGGGGGGRVVDVVFSLWLSLASM